MSNSIKAKTEIIEGVETRRIAVAMLSIMLGAFIFFGAGFAPMADVHNATHDTRHSFSLPCH